MSNDNNVVSITGVEPTRTGRIELAYPLFIERVLDEQVETFSCPNGASFFIDEHEVQWVSFRPTNGYNKGKEHMWRTDCIGFAVVSEKQS